jgi:hypothetical protein
MSLAALPAAAVLAVLLGGTAPAPSAPAGAPAPSTQAADPSGCAGTLSGAVTARFACTVTAQIKGEVATVTIEVNGPVEGLRALKPAVVSLPVPIPSGSYSGVALRSAASSLETTGGKSFVAGPGQGEVTLTVDQAERYKQSPNHLVMAGSLRARLVAAHHGKDEVILEVRF